MVYGVIPCKTDIMYFGNRRDIGCFAIDRRAVVSGARGAPTPAADARPSQDRRLRFCPWRRRPRGRGRPVMVTGSARPRSVGSCTPCTRCFCLGDFLDQASIPCLAYMRRGQPWLQRLLWILIFFVGLATFLYLFSSTMSSYFETPVITGPGKQKHPVWELPFPAVTICPESKINLRIFNFTDIVVRYRKDQEITEEDQSIFADLAHQCDFGDDYLSEKPNMNTINRIEMNALDVQEILTDVYFRNNKFREIEFKPVLTEVGFCVSFNMLSGKALFADDSFHASRDYLNYSEDVKWSPYSGYYSTEPNAYPYRTWGAGFKRGIHIFLFVSNDVLDYACSDASDGFKVEIHSPADFPLPEQCAMLVPLDSAVRISVSPRHVQTQPSLRTRFLPRERMCYFPGERSLRFFKFYTASNCELECLANITRDECGCVVYHMPRELDTPICGRHNMNCTREAELRMQQIAMDGNDSNTACNCLKNCDYTEYKSRLSFTNMVTSKFDEIILGKKWSYNVSRATKISIYFEERTYVPILRYEMYSWVDFVANCGGLLGLCLGMSILSLAELVYWIVVKLFWTYFRSLSRIAQTHPQENNKNSLHKINIFNGDI